VEDSVASDTTPPQTTITSAAPDPASTSATFEFTASEQSTFECSLDDAAFASCTSPATYSALADEPHSFRVRATDRGGYTDPTAAEQDWTVDTFFSLAATPDSLSMAPEGYGESTLQTSGSAQPITLSASGQPATVGVWFSPSFVVAGGSSTMMVTVGTATEPGTYTIVVTGAGTSVSHTTTVTLVVSATDFSLSATPFLMYVQQGSSGTGTVGTFSLTQQTVALSATGQPAGTSVRSSPASVTAGASSTMTVSVPSGTLYGNYPLTIVGTGPSTTHTLTITLIVERSNADFSIVASPASLDVARGAAGTTTIQTATTSGSPQAIGLSATGRPAGTVVSFDPAAVTAGGSSTMTVNVGTATAPGTYAITVIGSGTSVAHATTVALTVTTNQPPTAAFAISCSGLTCSFDAGVSTDSDGTLLSYSWSFGDGTGGSGKTATHIYSGSGSYTVTLTVTDDAGATATDSQTVHLIVLTARGYKVKGLQKVDLTWSAPSGASFDVYRDGAKIATVQATAYTDNLNAKGSATHTYRVCAPAMSSCSNEAKVSF
jgi:PKD repeat protein